MVTLNLLGLSFVLHLHSKKPSKRFFKSSLRTNNLLGLDSELTEVIGLVSLDQTSMNLFFEDILRMLLENNYVRMCLVTEDVNFPFLECVTVSAILQFSVSNRTSS